MSGDHAKHAANRPRGNGILTMAKKKAAAREYLWLQCSETGDLNYRTEVNTKGGMPEKLKEGLKKYSPRVRKHTLHKVKKK